MSEHTKEPWHTGKNHNAERFIYGEDGWAIAECVQTKDKMFANARRIVACVNACAEISTETLESAGISAATKSSLNGYIHIKAQRDELLAALEKIESETAATWVCDVARAAIAKVEATL